MTIEELLAEIDLIKVQLRSQQEMQRVLMVVLKNWVERVVELEAAFAQTSEGGDGTTTLIGVGYE